VIAFDPVLANAIGSVRVDVGNDGFERSLALVLSVPGGPGAPGDMGASPLDGAGAASQPIPMRLWTLHPRYLDAKGLVAAWREALLAQKVLKGATKGYRHHPQLVRFQAQPDAVAAIAAFLAGLAAEAGRRGYHFDATKISRRRFAGTIPETRGQLLLEWRHLKRKLRIRSPKVARGLRGIAQPDPHPLFRIVAGGRRSWERAA
jgi:hypothetical protein